MAFTSLIYAKILNEKPKLETDIEMVEVNTFNLYYFAKYLLS